MRRPGILLLWFLLLTIIASGQRKTTHKDQLWVGYMTSITLSDRYSLWNDLHVVPGSFAIIRTGLSRSLFPNSTVTGGYAFLFLPTGSTNHLERQEHRPWAQLQFTLPAGHEWTLSQRIRYDARFKQNISEEEPADGFSFNHRVRLLISLRKDLAKPRRRMFAPYAVLSNEVLLNFGKEITYNTFDQNRLALSFGVQREQIQYQLGLMNRFVQTGPSTFTLNHTLILWVTQKFDLRGISSKKS
jgi:hypothetical protein